MAKFELRLPKMGESVAEATITNWLKKVGDHIAADEAVLEIATDKVDSEVPSEVSGTLSEIFFKENDVVQVGQIIAYIETEGGVVVDAPSEETTAANIDIAAVEKTFETAKDIIAAPLDFSDSEKFYSPLVKNIAKEEGISLAELETIAGSGKDGRVTKSDILEYVSKRQTQSPLIPQGGTPQAATKPETSNFKPETVAAKVAPVSVNGQDEIVEMDRMRKLISGYMVQSVQTSAHVQSFIEVDVTNIVKWRDKVKTAFEKREGEKLTYTPIFMEAVAKALKDYPGLNISIDGDYIIKKKNINLGMAAALPNGNLIVPVIKNADQLNLVGMAKAVNDLGNRAKAGKLKPDDTQGGTYTVTNVGTFGSVFGTPIINQPQVGILALGAIRKVPAVIETPEGDFIGIRQKMFLSHSYDHRVVDGALGGSFVKRVAEYLEAFDVNRDY
ncbi:diapophytoene dehydrogenase [Flavobacterium rivuli WB 3.3-2 = DSM 21788]|uniref:Dihydrolipoamide acetyltransferase component of pyruvate dehydrogenase complex n=1 Tax=Flavobacterium rivuli WB 3.3-2 = DSM 21788 TaxID=1121895 RepID=A0A0A2M5N0_9FLAO|nr:dihydrolipoamide acetyltransferase family protein [Flavobacterium rivuli]KGO87574.1 diapophytoene dehydrogenase [Flavobacterium rivuli WB 3.3-2 = DSM 21788]